MHTTDGARSGGAAADLRRLLRAPRLLVRARRPAAPLRQQRAHVSAELDLIRVRVGVRVRARVRL